MKTIGLLGGMSWESTVLYYQRLNEGVRKSLGGLHSAPILLHSVDFAAIEHFQVTGQWAAAGDQLAEAALSLEQAGADMVLICTNLMHKVAPQIEARLQVPLLHIADAVGRAVVGQGLTRVGLLGARYTMEEGFYRDRLKEKYGVEVMIPSADARNLVHDVIFRELCCGTLSPSSRDSYLAIIDSLQRRGAQGVILGCTEIPLLVSQEQVDLPLFNTVDLHADYALEVALGAASAIAV